jgi:hypothetical protein
VSTLTSIDGQSIENLSLGKDYEEWHGVDGITRIRTTWRPSMRIGRQRETHMGPYNARMVISESPNGKYQSTIVSSATNQVSVALYGTAEKKAGSQPTQDQIESMVALSFDRDGLTVTWHILEGDLAGRYSTYQMWRPGTLTSSHQTPSPVPSSQSESDSAPSSHKRGPASDIFCTSCNRLNKSGYRYCCECGKDLYTQ